MSRPNLTTVQKHRIEVTQFKRKRTVEEEFEYKLRPNPLGSIVEPHPIPELEEKGKAEWFPDTSEWGIESLQRETGEIYMKPGSKWSVNCISKLQQCLEQISNEEQRQRTRNFDKWQFNKLGIRKLAEAANESFGFNGWNTEVLFGTVKPKKYVKIEHLEEDDDDRPDRFTLELEIDVKLKLKDGTTVIKTGKGRADFQPLKYMAFSKARKEAITDATKSCIYGLIELCTDYEEKVRSGYYQKYN